ncbi:MAG TPA: J domain-containing protein [Acidimicrobiales bacterium]|nr:J domain-containing protein [Acidimicrobiales bacterium]
MTPYEVLGIGPKAKPAEITAAYRVLAQIFHPDRFAGAPAAVQKEAARRMSEVNEAYAFFRGSNNSRGEHSVARERAARAAAATPWHEVVRQRAQAEARAKEQRRAREESTRQGKAISRPKTGGAKLALAGMGEALHTNKITCRECKSIQWLPDGWRERLDTTDYYCSICSRLILAR